ncbi:unnamed protein product [Urochloa humidicola]
MTYLENNSNPRYILPLVSSTHTIRREDLRRNQDTYPGNWNLITVSFSIQQGSAAVATARKKAAPLFLLAEETLDKTPQNQLPPVQGRLWPFRCTQAQSTEPDYV